MGYFGNFLFADGRWTECELDAEPPTAEPWLLLTVHDSDIAGVVYRPCGAATGTAFLGYTPRRYFQLDDASAPTDVALEAAGLADWWVGRGGDAGSVAAKAAELAGFLASDAAAEGDDEAGTEDADEEELDDAEIFVEIKAGRFLRALGLEPPEDLPQE